MSGIIHTTDRASWARKALIVAGVCGLAAVAWQAVHDPDPAPPVPMVASSNPATPTAPPPAGQAFPDLRIGLVQVSVTPAPPSAVLQVEARQASFSLGQEVFPGVLLERIQNDRVVLRYGALTRTVFLAALPTRPEPNATAQAPTEIRVRNQGIDVRLLTQNRFKAADAFLREVHLTQSPRGGFVVSEVERGGVYEKMGVRPGDVVYSLDTPAMTAVDESSMVALMQQPALELDVYRHGTQVRLRHVFGSDADEAPPASAPRN